MAGLKSTLELEKKAVALLDDQGFEDADDWGPDDRGCVRWAIEVERGDSRSALSNLVAFLEELDSAGIRQEPARQIIGDGKRTAKMMKDLLEVRNKLLAEGHGDQIENIVTSSTSVHAAQQRLKSLLNPPSALEERTTKRQRKQAERPGYVNTLDPRISFSHSNPKNGHSTAADQGRAAGIGGAELPKLHPVQFIDLSPERVFVADAALHPSDRARELASTAALKESGLNRFGQPTPTGLRYALVPTEDGELVESEHAGKLDQQIMEMIKTPEDVEKNVAVFEITDEDHPAFKGRVSKHHPAYGSFSRRRMQKMTVLGAYGGHTKVGSKEEGQDVDPIDGSDDRANCQFSLHLETEKEEIYVDADKFCNHLAFCNDYRTDVEHPNIPEKQEGYYNHQGKLGNKRHNVEVTIVWKEKELFPRLFFITKRAVQANEELLVDYGEEFWLTQCGDEQQLEQQQAGGSQSSQTSSAELCSQSSQSSQPVGLRRRNSLSSGEPTIRTTSRLAERERLLHELEQWKEEMQMRERQFEEEMKERRQLFETQQRQWMVRVIEREKELRLVGRQVLENFPGHGSFRGMVIGLLDGQSNQGRPTYKVRYTDGKAHKRSELRLLNYLVDREAEDQEAKQKIAGMPPSSDEEEEMVVEGEGHEESTQPFVDDESDEQVELMDDQTLECAVVGQIERVWAPAVNSAPREIASVSPPAEMVSRPIMGDQPE